MSKQPAKGKSRGQKFGPYCIYTIIQSQEFLKKARAKDSFSEKKTWATAGRLLTDCQRDGQLLPLVLAPAEDTNLPLFAVAIIERIKFTPKGTTIFYRRRRLLKPGRAGSKYKTDLWKKSDRERLPAGFIRPYAICHTPSFLKPSGTQKG